MPVCFSPSRFTLYLTGTDRVSTQRLTRSGGPKYSLTPARAEGSPIPPDGRPFTCTDPRPTAMKATLGFSFDGLSSDQADDWRAAFSAGQTVYVSMDIGPKGVDGTEFLIVDLRVATVAAALSSAKMAIANGFSDGIAFLRSLGAAVQFSVVGLARLFGKAPNESPALASAGLSKRVD
jgi:hypothetical protein